MVRLIASASMRYQGRMLQPGERFEAPHKDAEDLIATQFATRDGYDRRDLEAEPVTSAEPAKRKYVRSGKYSRRDRVAKT